MPLEFPSWQGPLLEELENLVIITFGGDMMAPVVYIHGNLNINQGTRLATHIKHIVS
jgi:hypothetical protein